ncbi:MAG: hypothetical protein KIT08_10610 [Anaerolineales bacterium]|nr:MAG: hypothetical protein KIT08_10610 [Anaerolineales bacterium]
MASAPASVAEYIKTFPKGTQEKLVAIRKIIKDVAPTASESVSYRIAGYKLDGKVLMYFAGHSQHVAVYPIPPLPAETERAVRPYLVSKGTLRFALDKPLPLGLIRKVAQGHVRRVRPAGAKAPAKKAPKKAAPEKRAAEK